MERHDWITKYSTYKNGEYWNYYKCAICGLSTRDFKHGDFEDGSKAIEEVEKIAGEECPDNS